MGWEFTASHCVELVKVLKVIEYNPQLLIDEASDLLDDDLILVETKRYGSKLRGSLPPGR